jgi:uncharacterized protein YggE
MERFFAETHARIMGLLLLLVAIIALAAYAQLTFRQAQFVASGPTTISVSGEGEAIGIPDVAQFTFSVESVGQEAAAAQNASAEAMNAILAYLREQGVVETDIQTTGYNLYPNWRYEERVCPVGSFCPPGERVQDGFTVSQSVAVKVRNLDVAGDLLSGVGQRGATNLSGLMFTVDDEDALQAAAQAEAIADAQAKAQVLADSLGVSLVRLVGFYEDQAGPYPVPYGMGGDMMMREEAVKAPELPAGESELVRRVTLTFEVE